MASSSHIPPNMEGIQLNEPNKRQPEDGHEPKGKRGRPRKKQQSEMSPEPMLIDKELKRPQKPSPPQSKKKSKKQRMLDALNSYEQDVADEPEASNIPEETQQPTTFKVKKTIKKDTENKQIPPGQIGIQRLRELLEDAKI